MMRGHLDREITDADRLAGLDDRVALDLGAFEKDTIATLIVSNKPGPVATEDLAMHATTFAIWHHQAIPGCATDGDPLAGTDFQHLQPSCTSLKDQVSDIQCQVHIVSPRGARTTQLKELSDTAKSNRFA